jgi:hypothetical chaperone protein
LKRQLSSKLHGELHFSGGGVSISAEVRRAEFEGWVAEDLRRIEAAMDTALVKAGIAPEAIDRVFLTGGSSLIPAIRALFNRRFGKERIATGGELTSIAHGLALIGEETDPAQWAA